MFLGLPVIIVATIFLYSEAYSDGERFNNFILKLASEALFLSVLLFIIGTALRLIFIRYGMPLISSVLRDVRVKQTDDEISDIREKIKQLNAKDFDPTDYYQDEKIFFGLDENNEPLYVDYEDWTSSNFQCLGATRHGKGIVYGIIMDQLISRGDTVFYIDPKTDDYAPYIMKAAAEKAGRKFIYLSLSDEIPLGQYAPFEGGTFSEAYSRAEIAFGLNLTGDPGTDYYKGQEQQVLSAVMQKTRTINAMSVSYTHLTLPTILRV